jgi:serine/threonine-protein kinase
MDVPGFASARLGTRIAGKFRLERVLGVGGMGVVYEAVNEATQRRFAIKIVHPEVTRDPAGRERIAREATAPNEIGHPGLVDVWDAGTDADGTLYLCMELLEGRSLREWLATEGATLGEAVSHVLSALEPLAAAHAKGFVHRDLKPENVFIARDRVKLVDFGLVRRTDATSASITGTTIGTVHYMSPEQARGSSQATAASDVWSVGVMLHEILTGARPFEGESALDVMMKATSDPHISIAERAPGVPASLAALIDECLAKDPLGRPRDASALEERLASAVEELRATEAWARPVDREHFAGELSKARGATQPMTGPSSGAALVAPTVALPASGAPDPDFDDMKLPSSSGAMLKVVLGILALTVIGGGAFFALAITNKSYDPTRLTIGVTGGGEQLQARLLEGLDAEVRRFGFLTSTHPSADHRALLADADEEGAAHAVWLELSSERVRDGLTSETGYFRQGLTLHLYDTETGEEVTAHELTFGSEALADSEASPGLLSAWIHSLGPQLIETLYARPSVAGALEGAGDVEIHARAIELDAMKSDVDVIRETRAQITDRCRELGEAHAAANAGSAPRVQCYGDPCGETYLIGLTPDGASAIVQIESSQPFVNFTGDVRFAETEERIERVPLGGGEPSVLATAANFYGVGAMSPGGTGVALIEQGRGENIGVIGLDAATGERRIQAVLGPRRAPDTVLPSPDGNAILLTSWGHGIMLRAGRELSLPSLGITGPRWVAMPNAGIPQALAAYARWNDQLVLLREDGTPAVPPATLVGRFEGIAGAYGALLHLLLRDSAGCHHARFDPSTGQMSSVTPISDCLDQPRLTGDGRLAGIANVTSPEDTPGDPEIALVDPDDGHVRPLTRGTFRETNLHVAGTRVAFQRYLENPEGVSFDSRRSVVCWLDLD